MRIGFLRDYYTFSAQTFIDIDQNGFNVVVGNNGAGKTTLIRALEGRRRKQIEGRFIVIEGMVSQRVLKLDSESFRAQKGPFIDTQAELYRHGLRQKSHGEAWKVELEKLKSKMGNNTFIIMDEPETALSTESQIQLAEWLVDMKHEREGIGALISTHSLLLIEMLGDSVIEVPSCKTVNGEEYLREKRGLIEKVVKKRNFLKKGDFIEDE